MIKVAVTGATGFVGKFVATYLESKGYEVYRFGRKNEHNILFWDITEGTYPGSIAPDVVIHCAAEVSDWSPYRKAYAANVIGTENVIKSFPTATTFIYISSASIYSPTCKETIITEEVCVGGRGLNNYGKTKLLGEYAVQESTVASKIILRPHIIYGPGDTTIGPRIKGSIKHGRFIIPGNGKNHISFTHVENLALAIWQSILRSRPGTSIYNITDADSPVFNDAVAVFKKLNSLDFKEVHIPRWCAMSIGTLLQMIYKALGRRMAPPLTPYIVHQITNNHMLDISKARIELGYTPTKTYEKDFIV